MLKQMRDSPFKSELFEGGRGGQAFGGLFDQKLVDQMSHGAGNKLVNAVVRKFDGGRAYGARHTDNLTQERSATRQDLGTNRAMSVGAGDAGDTTPAEANRGAAVRDAAARETRTPATPRPRTPRTLTGTSRSMSPQPSELDRLAECLKALTDEHHRLLDLVRRHAAAMRTMDVGQITTWRTSRSSAGRGIAQGEARRRMIVAASSARRSWPASRP
jgi:Rod binding domain-containing protein